MVDGRIINHIFSNGYFQSNEKKLIKIKRSLYDSDVKELSSGSKYSILSCLDKIIEINVRGKKSIGF